MLNCVDALTRIRTADDNRQKWLLAAEMAEKIYESGLWRQTYGRVGDWIEAAAEAAQIGPNMLRRWMAARRFIISFGEAHPEIDMVGMGETGLLPFSAVEILKRMNDLSPDETVATIQRFKGEPITVRDLKRIYAPVLGKVQQFTVPGGPSKPFVEEMGFDTHAIDHRSFAAKVADRGDQGPTEAVLAMIQDRLGELSGPSDKVSLFLRHYRFRYVRPLAVAVGRQDYGIDFVDAFDFKRIRYPFPRLIRNQMLAEAEFASTFFRRYWLVLTGPINDATNFAQEVAALGLQSVGILWGASDGSDEMTILTTPSAMPLPDRTALAKADVFKQGVPV